MAHPFEWPGLHCAEALATGRPLEGVWIDRTKAYNARMAGEIVELKDLPFLGSHS